ncbi:WD40-repeat-containing domain protein [Sphaerosporella brunnea]|uniref:WD40-repeat-containing domain protein n=1 Tax=Sphaerosporella brunnea TaxID=1250544 RepID=A0A5J5F2P1_9PEZI|nr:WD40-repeat-containing domain protein [Sphaerosporella brunnea]
MSLPSIKISKTAPPGSLDPVTPNSDAETPASSITDTERPGTGGRRDTVSAGPKASNGSFVKAGNDHDKPPPSTPPPKATRRGTPGSIQRETSTVDPITLSILRRTGTENVIPKAMRNDGNDDPEKSGAQGSNGGLPDNTKPNARTQGGGKKKGVSFFSRIMGNKKKVADEEEEPEPVDGDRRTEGMDAAVFSQPIGFTPTFPAPPRYIRVHASQKPQRDFNQIFLAQELSGSPSTVDDEGKEATMDDQFEPESHKSGAIWAMKFSKDGKYLAASGQDKVVRVWQVLGSKEDRATHEQEEDAAGEFTDEAGVRLNAPVFMAEPIQEYHGHTGDVLDLSWSKNNFLLSSSMDKTVRLWHVTRKECLCCFQHSDFVTSIAFHPRDDRFFLAGSLDSKLRLWSIPDKSVAFWNELPDLITAVAFTPDGRMAIAGCLNGLCLFYETEGLRYHTQLHVRSSHGRNAKGSKITGIETVTFPPEDPNGEVKILITSNDSRVRMYNFRDKSLETKFKGYENTCSQIHATFSDDTKYVISGSEDRKVYIWNVGPGDTEKKDKRPVEFFEANPAITTVAIMAPNKTKQVLSQSGDPIYDLCNPPPITLVSRSDSLASSKKTVASPSSTAGDDMHHTATRDTTSTRPPTKSSWNARCNHPAGNIIVTADYTGHIKIFRQDCAATKRKNESLDTASILSKRIGSGILRKGSLSHGSPDRIISWRQSVGSIHSLDGGSIRSLRSRASNMDTGINSPRRRSVSPGKGRTTSITSTSSKFGPSLGSLRSRAQSLSQYGNRERNGSIGRNSVKSDSDPISESRMRESSIARELSHSLHTSPDVSRGKSGRNMVSSDEDDNDIFSSDAESEGEAVRCRKCGSTSFKAKQRRGEHKLVCVK